MKIKVKNLLLVAVAAATFTALADTGVPGFSQESDHAWTAKYYHASIDSAPSENWYTTDFDDSEWGTLQGPIYRNGSGGTTWNDYYTAYWLRTHFTLDDIENLNGVILKVLHDDGCRVYLNGTMVYDEESVKYESVESSVDQSFLKKGENVIAVYVADTGGGDAFIDFGLDLIKNEVLDIDVPAPGTMGDVILGKVNDFTDVQSIRISGKLDSSDMETLCKRLTNLRIIDMAKADLKEIGNNAFNNHAKLMKVVLPENLEKIGSEAFINCKVLTEVIFPESLRTIGRNAFQSTALNSLELREGLTSLGDRAFQHCRQLERLSLPSTLKTIPEQAFYDNTNLSEIYFSEGLESIGNQAFSGLEYVQELSFPSSLQTINVNAFYNDHRLRDIKFNEGLTRIGDNAFYHCDSLREVTLPSTLLRADASPFDYCDNLRKVTCLSIEPPYMTDQIPYGRAMEGRELYVPAIALNIYKQTMGWDKFPAIKPIDSYPADIIISRDERLTLLENLPSGYKPNLTLKDVYIDSKWSYGRLEVNGNANISLGKLSMVMDPNESSSYHPFTSLITNVPMKTDSVEVILYPTGNRWIFISLPFDVRVGDIRSCKDGTTSFAVRRYSGANRAAGESGSTWQDLGEDDIMKAGEGYILQAVRYIGNSRQDYVGLVLPSTYSENLNNVFLISDAMVTLEEYPAELEHNRGWNLIGNPYPCYYDSRFMSLEAPVTVWDRNTYKVYSPLDDSYVFTPGESFFVQCPAGKPDVLFDVDGRQKTREVRELSVPLRIAAKDDRKVFNFTLSGQNGEDAARIVFNEDAAMGYESNRDAAKFFSHEDAVGQLFTVAGDVEYAINERPAGDGHVTLGIRIGATGSYTIELSGDGHGYQVWLDDAATGDSVRLDGSAGYSFNVDPCKVADRFTLRFVGAGVNAVEVIGSESADGDAAGMYTIDGRSVAQPESGTIYIKNGKKVVVK